MDKINTTVNFINTLKDSDNRAFLEGIEEVYKVIMEGYESPVGDMVDSFTNFIDTAYKNNPLLFQIRQNELANKSKYVNSTDDKNEKYHTDEHYMRSESYTVNGRSHSNNVSYDSPSGFDGLLD